MAKKNPFLEQIARERDAAFLAGLRVGIQWNNDIFQLVLRDPDVVGKDTFGTLRLAKIHHAAEDLSEELFDALDARRPESDVCRDKIDRELRRALSDKFKPFEERYYELVHCSYGGKKK